MQFPRLLLALAAFVLAGPGSAPAQPATPALWVVRDTDTTLWLFGSVHELKPQLAWFTGSVRHAFDASDTLVLELIVPPRAEIDAVLRDTAPPADAKPLPERLPPAYRPKLAAALKAASYSADAFDRMDPWLAATTLSVLPLRRAGFSREASVEPVLTKAARAAGKPVEGLETQAGQIAMFDTLPESVQLAMLTRVLDGQDGAAETMTRTAEAWARGDTQALAAIVADDMRQSPDLVQQRLLTDRHARWADWIARRMERPGVVFVAVGTGHLVGPGSLQQVLSDRGIRVARVSPPPTAP